MSSENQVAKVENGAIKFDYGAFAKDCHDRAAMIAAQAVDWQNPNALKPVVTENNKFIKEKKAMLESIKDSVLEASGYTTFETKVLVSLKEVEVANKKLTADRLEAEKVAKKERARQFFLDSHFGDPDANGEMLDFERVWELDWAKTTVTWGDLVAKMSAKVVKLRSPDEKVDAFIEIDGIRASRLAEVEAYLKAQGIAYTIERRA